MAIVLEFKVVPNSKTQGFEYASGGLLKCRLKSKPEGGRANEELVKFLGKQLGVCCDCIKILRGVTSRKKVIKIDTKMPLEDVYFKLGVEIQSKIL